jgi:hypothetical protein
MCCLYNVVSPLGMSVFEIQLLATDYKLGCFYLAQIISVSKSAIYMVLLVLWVCRIQNNFLFPKP